MKIRRWMAMALCLVLALTLLPGTAFAATLSKTFTVGENVWWIFFDGGGRDVDRYSLENGSLPDGLELGMNRDAAMVNGTPTKAGTWTAYVSVAYASQNSTPDVAEYTLKITVNPAATAKPTATPSTELEITKHPTGETVKEGGKTSFIARADNDTSRKWYFVKNSETVLASDAESHFPGLKVSGTREEKLALSNIPVSVNGWSVYCTFTGKDGKLSSKQAKITVTASATAAPATTSQPTASAASVSATPTLAPTAPPTATPEPHTHAFGAQWQSDATQHWQSCACGEKANAAEHIVAKWAETRKVTKVEPGQETGVCAVCGRIVTRAVAYTGGADVNLLLLIAVLMLIAVVSVLIILLVQKRRRSNRRRIHKDDLHRPE